MIDYSNRITPENIKELNDNEIFCFGSNRSNIHGAGAAKHALKFGAKYGIGGLRGLTYALPTKDEHIRTLQIEEIKKEVIKFIDLAYYHPDLTFLVTKIGCGLAGYSAEDIAPLFIPAINLKNVHLPLEFWEILDRIASDTY